jgi:hypothetical protein
MTPADYTAAFVAGARWWAEREGQAFDAEAMTIEADKRISRLPESSQDRGFWPASYAGRAFVSGAKWQEFSATDGTMWTRDQDEAEIEAERRYPIGAQA